MATCIDLGVEGIHAVHREVAPRPGKTILPPDPFEHHANIAIWQKLPGGAPFEIVPKLDETPAAAQSMPEPAQKTN